MGALYSETILEHYRRPRNRGSLERPDLAHEGVNPLCGDRIRIEIQLEGDRVREARFRGDACAISVAAASILTERIRGLSLTAAATFSEQALLDALEAEIRPGRIRCALLPLEVLRKAASGRAEG
jgi:nitrogen fixation NifU-like protein